MNNHLVVLSGGQDSTICLYMAIQEALTPKNVHVISFDYGQKHKVELQHARAIATMANVASYEVIYLDDILKSVSPLVSADIGLEQYSDNEQMEKVIGKRVELTFVPMRNPLFLTIAANRAVHHKCVGIWTGICADDNANYPDCTLGFKNRMQAMIRTALGSGSKMQLITPLVKCTKAEAIDKALRIPQCYEALGYTHTSYAGDFPPLDRNHATVLREHAFQEAGVPDPLIVKAVLWNKMRVPQLPNYKDVDWPKLHSMMNIERALKYLEWTLRVERGYT